MSQIQHFRDFIFEDHLSILLTDWCKPKFCQWNFEDENFADCQLTTKTLKITSLEIRMCTVLTEQSKYFLLKHSVVSVKLVYTSLKDSNCILVILVFIYMQVRSCPYAAVLARHTGQCCFKDQFSTYIYYILDNSVIRLS